MDRLDHFLEKLGGILSDPERRALFLRSLPRRMRWLLRVVFAVFVIVSLAFLGIVEWIGERNLFTAFFLFLPAQIWFVPLGMFMFAAVCLLDWRLALSVAAVTGAFVLFYLDWEMSGPRAGDGGKELVVMTFNRGQRAGSLRPFKKANNPDILAMQEAPRQSKQYLKVADYQDLLHGEDVGEFMLLSKFPIIEKELLDLVGFRGKPIAAKFTVDFDGEEIVIFNIHLDTPRGELLAFRRGAFLHGLWPGSAAAKSHQEFWAHQIKNAKALIDIIEAERRPAIVVGDLNTPDHGYIYRQFRSGLQDAHEVAGRGFGCTFPGETRNPLTLFGPWLRIDHVFASDAWRPLECQAESGRRSQHLAVAARFELRE